MGDGDKLVMGEVPLEIEYVLCCKFVVEWSLTVLGDSV